MGCLWELVYITYGGLSYVLSSKKCLINNVHLNWTASFILLNEKKSSVHLCGFLCSYLSKAKNRTKIGALEIRRVMNFRAPFIAPSMLFFSLISSRKVNQELKNTFTVCLSSLNDLPCDFPLPLLLLLSGRVSLAITICKNESRKSVQIYPSSGLLLQLICLWQLSAWQKNKKMWLVEVVEGNNN